jgi:hypothetical protein
MAPRFRAGALVLSLFLASAVTARAQQSAPAAQAQSVTVVGQRDVSAWFRAESQHFVVFSDTSNEDITQLLNNLEKLDHLLRIYTKAYRKADRAEHKLTFYYHSRPADLNAIDANPPADAVGLYSSCASGVQGFGVHLWRIAGLDSTQLAKAPLNESLSYLFEAYTRHFLYRYTDIRTPTSFIDGFAHYFSSVRFSDNQLAVGRVPTGVGSYIQFLDQGHRYSLDYTDILEQNDSNGRNYAGTAGVRLEFEAKSWLLTHYMLSSEENRARMDKYLNLAARDIPATQAFERAFDLKVSDLASAMWRYSRGGLKVIQVELPSLPDARISFRSLPMADGEFILADAALKSCPGHRAGEALLQKVGDLARKFPNNDAGRLTLSRAQIDWGNARDALPWLTAATQGSKAGFEAFHLLGLANLRLAGQHNDAAGKAYLDAAQRNLSRALELNPASPEAAFALFKATVNATDEPSASALQGVIAAWENAHEVNTLAGAAALAHAYAGNVPKAKWALRMLARNVRDPDMAAWAKQWQSRLDAGASRADILAEMRREATPLASFKEWTIDSTSVMQTVVYNAGLEDAQHYLDGQAQGNPMKPGDVLHNSPTKR